jgi:hypothetical protein
VGSLPLFGKMVFSGDGNRLVCPARVKKGGADIGQVFVWETQTGQKKGEIELEKGVIRVSISTDGKMVACTIGDFLGEGAELWDVDANQRYKLDFKFPNPLGLSHAAELGAGGKILAATFYQNAKLFDVGSKQAFAELQSGQNENLFHLGISANGKMVGACAAQQKYVIVWHTPSLSRVAIFDTAIKSPEIVLSPDGRYLAAFGRTEFTFKDYIEVWELSAAAAPGS